MKEEWLAVPGHPMFEASRTGKIRTPDRIIAFTKAGAERTSKLKGRVLSPWVGNNGYLHVSHKANGTRRKFLVHRLVCLTFNPGFAPGLSVNHINGVKTDNRSENLEWCTLAQNTAHQWRIGLVNNRGENHPMARLTDEQAAAIRTSASKVASLAAQYNVSHSAIYKIRSGLRR